MTRRRRALAGVVVGATVTAVLAACTTSSGPASPAASSGSSAATGSTAVTSKAPPATGVVTGNDPRATQIVDVVRQSIPELQLQSVVFGVWVGDEQIARGAIDAPSVQPATSTDAIVRVGQPMEAMLGTILLQLGREGVIDLDQPVAKYVPDLVNADRITPRMLANSTGGTPDYVPDPGFSARVSSNPFAGYTFGELLGYAQKTPPLFDPGTSWAYSHTEMAALVQVLEKASGKSLDELMASRIFKPLGMTASSAHKNNAIAEPAMHAYTNQRNMYEDSTYWDPTWGLNGGMNASVADLGRWLRALNTGQLLNEADAKESLSPVTAGKASLTDQRYFAYGSLVAGNWIIGNPSLNGYMGFTAQQRNPSVTIVVWSTAAVGSPESANASQAISQRIAGIVSADPFQMPAPK